MSAQEELPKRPIPYAKQCIDDLDIAAVVEALRSDFLTQGPRLGYFEDALKEVSGSRYAVAVSSGTAALHLSCLGLGCGDGDYGVVPAITFAATANCLRYCGADVAFCDVDPVSGKAFSEQFREAVENSGRGSAPKVLLPVSFSGSVPDLDSISEYGSKLGSFVVEDAAHSIGATYLDRQGRERSSASCTHSDAAVLSFHPVKQVCAGEGGAVLTNDETLARRVRRLSVHGIERGTAWTYDQQELGYNYRMTELQAALGKSQLEKLAGFTRRRQEIVNRYRDAFAEDAAFNRIRLSNTDVRSAHHLFIVHFSNSEERKAAYDYLHEQGIRVQVHYLPVYKHSDYNGGGSDAFPGAENYYATCLSLPVYPALEVEEQAYVIDRLKLFLTR